ncbi:MAG: phosphomannomutase/phosphoglucomutase [Nanoarchaeota archaeon]|nr:phosphomannomutase/phosphoglucomutase [Nanoarchaeota archaeon]
MAVNEKIFKAYDIRGIYPEDIDADIAYRIGRAYATLVQGENKGRRLKIVVAADMRISSPELKETLIKGLNEQGVDVVDIGLASTPTFYFGVANYGYDGGMQVSASHNPKEYNGFKLVRKNAIPVSGDTGIMDIKELVKKNDFTDPEDKGTIETKEGVLDDQVEHDLKYADLSRIKPFKVVADTANSMGSPYLEALFAKLPCRLIKMNFELDGNFPAHQADPYKEENVADLQKRIVEERADLGIATDGDGDRIFFIDERGETVPPYILRGLLAKIFLKDKPGATICYDIRPGRITRDMIIENGGKPVVTRVGHSLIKEKMMEVGAYFGGESSGHFFLHTENGYYEVPMIVTLKILEELSASGKTFSELISPYKKYFHSGEINSEVEDKEGMMKNLAEMFKDANDISYLDGVTIEFDDFWFNVRPSNTEPLLRLNLEAKTREKMEEMRDKVLAIIRR